MKTAKPELLAPCGSREALEAAVKAGADAVYLGGKAWNARMNARNFDGDALRSAIRYCHERGVRVYVTLNTQIYDRELAGAVKYVYELYSAGADALIITDLGLIALLRTLLPDLELHASTQLVGHNVSAARMCADLGMTRMVAARELRREDIEALCEQSPIEIELFVHGALCASQSGGCLFSSLVGGRSGNRGECAQPCRLPYSGSYPLSLKDSCLAGHLTSLTAAGAASLKIEGRMKSPEYVGGVVGTYHRLLDGGRDADRADMAFLAQLFSRSGFTDGYYTGIINADMLGVRTEADKAQRAPKRSLPHVSPREPISLARTSPTPPERLPDIFPNGGRPTAARTARFYDPSALTGEDYFDIIYLPLDLYNGRTNGVMLPPVILPHEYDGVRSQLLAARKKGCEHVLVTNIGALELARESGMRVHLDYRFNVYNTYSARLLEKYGDVMLSPELTLPQMRDIKADKSAVIYGRVPLMTLERRTGLRTLCDRRGTRFPVMREGAREIVFNSVPIYMADRRAQLKSAGIVNGHFIFSCETRAEVARIIEAYKTSAPPKGAFTRIKK